MRRNSDATGGASKEIAPEGQTAEQAPQPAHTIGSTATWSPAGERAPAGQMSRHLLQPRCEAREWAQRLSSIRT